LPWSSYRVFASRRRRTTSSDRSIAASHGAVAGSGGGRNSSTGTVPSRPRGGPGCRWCEGVPRTASPPARRPCPSPPCAGPLRPTCRPCARPSRRSSDSRVVCWVRRSRQCPLRPIRGGFDGRRNAGQRTEIRGNRGPVRRHDPLDSLNDTDECMQILNKNLGRDSSGVTRKDRRSRSGYSSAYRRRNAADRGKWPSCTTPGCMSKVSSRPSRPGTRHFMARPSALGGRAIRRAPGSRLGGGLTVPSRCGIQ